MPSGVSIESASYIENNNIAENNSTLPLSENYQEEYTPKLFSEDQNYQSEDTITENENGDKESDDSAQLFDQDTNEEEDFEIPAFLRKQKF